MALHCDVKNGLENFSQSQPTNQPACSLHAGSPHWLPIAQPDTPANYRCATCSPPPARAFVALWADADHDSSSPASTSAPTLVDDTHAPPHALTPTPHTPTLPCIISYEQPICPTCHCRWLLEVDEPAGISLRCWTCRLSISDQQLSDQLSKPKPLSKTLRKQG